MNTSDFFTSTTTVTSFPISSDITSTSLSSIINSTSPTTSTITTPAIITTTTNDISTTKHQNNSYTSTSLVLPTSTITESISSTQSQFTLQPTMIPSDNNYNIKFFSPEIIIGTTIALLIVLIAFCLFIKRTNNSKERRLSTSKNIKTCEPTIDGYSSNISNEINYENTVDPKLKPNAHVEKYECFHKQHTSPHDQLPLFLSSNVPTSLYNEKQHYVENFNQQQHYIENSQYNEMTAQSSTGQEIVFIDKPTQYPNFYDSNGWDYISDSANPGSNWDYIIDNAEPDSTVYYKEPKLNYPSLYTVDKQEENSNAVENIYAQI
ncbi:hypothetical protein HK099_007135 [Clydaea vesicula]|uniref:Uncharacterized protein n=1 Tax=Clydaea vesicula TaxID=447962 RepID=A0AAD5TXJ0_9FUNG|nr:hypothetical protein HK099_007135 [Clydaea vesicula]